MEFFDYLAGAGAYDAVPGMQGAESEWLRLAPFELRGKRLMMVSAQFVGSPTDGLNLPASPGRYIVEVRVTRYARDTRISRLRVFPEGVRERLEFGNRLGEVSVDHGGVAVCDIDLLQPHYDTPAYRTWIEDIHGSHGWEERRGSATFEPGATQIVFAEVGFGDGGYPAFALIFDDVPVGLELEAIPAGTPYPFGRAT